ncbi:MAG: amidohydrolase [Aristaeellaceae bacterium]
MLLIRNGLLHTMEEKAPKRADLLIREGKIIKIAPDIDPDGDAEIFDAAGMQVYPGLIDAHSHIGIATEKTTSQLDETNEGTTPVTPCMRAIDAINPMDSAFHNAIATGITGVMVGPGSANPIGGQFAFIKTDGRRIDDMIVLAPAAIKIAFGENPMTNYGPNGNMPSTRMGIAALIREELFKAQQYFAGGQDGQQKDFSLECYRDLFEGKIPLKAHVHRADDIFTAIRIAREFHLGLTLDHCTEGHLIAEEIAKSGYPAIVGPSLASRSKDEVAQSDFKTPGILHKAGVMVALTTDHPVSRIQQLPLCAALAAKEGWDAYHALRAITLDAAKICRVEDRVGSLKVGKDADLMICDGSPLDIATTVRATFIDGRQVWPRKDEQTSHLH